MNRPLFHPSLKTLLMLYLATMTGFTAAVEQIEVQALFGGKAMILIDGNRHTLAAGETSPEGVKLVKSTSKQAVLEVDGEQKIYQLGNTVSLNFARPKQHEETIYSDDRGMFRSVGTINGRTVEFLLDTGATTVAMNKNQAKHLGVDYRMTGEHVIISTASANVRGYRVTLKSVSLGKIKQRNVEAMVIDGNHPGPILLGMSFLGKLKVEKEGKAMTIKQRK